MNLQDYISRLSVDYKIPTNLVTALGRVQSDLTMASCRHDPTHQWLWDMVRLNPFRRLSDDEALSSVAPEGFCALHRDPETEYMGQRTSWGPFLLQGALAREIGYFGPFPLLCEDPEITTRFTLTAISHLRDIYFDKHGWAGVMAAFDAGRPRKDEEGRYTNRDFLVELNKNGARGLLHYL